MKRLMNYLDTINHTRTKIVNKRDIILLEQAYQRMSEDVDIDVDSLKHSMGNQDMEQTDYDAPYAVICHGQSYEWYGNDDPSTGEGRYKPKGDCGTALLKF